MLGYCRIIPYHSVVHPRYGTQKTTDVTSPPIILITVLSHGEHLVSGHLRIARSTWASCQSNTGILYRREKILRIIRILSTDEGHDALQPLEIRQTVRNVASV